LPGAQHPRTGFYAVFFLEAIATVAIWTIPNALSVSFAKNVEERPLYIGLSNTLCAPVTILGASHWRLAGGRGKLQRDVRYFRHLRIIDDRRIVVCNERSNERKLDSC